MLARVKVGHLVTRDDVIVGNDVIAGELYVGTGEGGPPGDEGVYCLHDAFPSLEGEFVGP